MNRLIFLAIALLPLSALAANVEVTWTHPTAFVDGTPMALGQIASTTVEYGTCVGTAFGVKVGEKVVAAPTASTTLTGFTPGLHCFRAASTATAAAGGGTSAFSAAASKTIPWPNPNPPTIVTVATVARLLLPSGRLGAVAGRIELGKACGERVDEKRHGDWYTVNREDVDLNRIGRSSVWPLVAKCG